MTLSLYAVSKKSGYEYRNVLFGPNSVVLKPRPRKPPPEVKLPWSTTTNLKDFNVTDDRLTISSA